MRKITHEMLENVVITYQIGRYYPATEIAALEELEEQITNKNRKMDQNNLYDLLDTAVSEWRKFADNFIEYLPFSQWQEEEEALLYSQSTTIQGVAVEITATIEL